MKMKLSWKYAIAIMVLLVVFLTVIMFISFPIISNIIKDIALKGFENEVSTIASIGASEKVFEIRPNIGYYYLISADGTTINHSDPTKIGNNIRDSIPGLVEYMVKNGSGVYSYGYEGQRRYVAFAYDGQNYLAHAATENELFSDLNSFKKSIFTLVYPISIILSLVLGYFFGEFFVRTPKKQIQATNELFRTISDSVISTSSSTAEIKAMAENTEQASMELDKSVEEFAAYLEESRAEIESILIRIKEFTNTIEEITNSTTQLANLTETLSQITERITEISDNITVLAINASIETSKQNIDRDGLARIAEMIMDLSNSTRTLSKESKSSLNAVERVVTSTVLITEKISKDLSSVRNSFDAIGQVTAASTSNVDKLARISKTTHESVEQLYSGVEQFEDAINRIKDEVQKFSQSMNNIVL
ncbi:MAG TPA: methyl-accepting chemotaxis protein [Fervidobacterium sp.]|nr:methyl-accepting chemotaxis protein [Fervidobacterium sp.]